ncbi:MAG: peptide-methionine (S)-S-oxide reductase MsrA [Fusobacteria bacterium]|nr:peptide-methionine (S)-S-oxide reductase MsrA [Fusobacteriota bacterium]
MREIVIAGGCFWGVEAYFRRLKGIENSEVGYSQGQKNETDYKEVCSGVQNFVEVCKLFYDEKEVKLEKIITHMFRFIDPTSENMQGADVGVQYRTGVYTANDRESDEVREILKKMQKNYHKRIVLEVETVRNYVSAENYHQDYLEKNPNGYCHVDLTLLKEFERKV